MSLQSELSSLFDIAILRRADRLRPAEVNAFAVHEAAGALLRLKGKPARQVELVKAMTPNTAAALCRWLADPSFWGLVAGITKH